MIFVIRNFIVAVLRYTRLLINVHIKRHKYLCVKNDWNSVEVIFSAFYLSELIIYNLGTSQTPRHWISTLIESKSNLPTRSYLYPWLWLAAGDYRQGGWRRERQQGKGLIDGSASRRYFSATRYYFIIPRHRSSIIRNHFLAHSLPASSADQSKFRPAVCSHSHVYALKIYFGHIRRYCGLLLVTCECAVRALDSLSINLAK